MFHNIVHLQLTITCMQLQTIKVQPSVGHAEEFEFCSRDGTPMRSRNCSSNDTCSSSCRCFDGKNEQMENTEEFNVDGIEGQGETKLALI